MLNESISSYYEYHTLDVTPGKNQNENWIHEHIHDCDHPEYPLPDNYFDIVICSDVIEHVKNQDILLKEIKRVLKNDGEIFLTTPNYSSIPCIKRIVFGKMFHNPCGGELEQYCFNGHVRYYTTKDLIPYLETFDLFTSHIIQSGIVTDAPNSGKLFKFMLEWIYNPLCLKRTQFVHQTILILTKSKVDTKIVKC